MEGKKTRGRQRIPMRKIENEGDRFATFSKRRKGFYKKASELCWLSSSDIGIVLTSPTGKIFSFFNPTPESITNRFFNQNQPFSECSQAIDAHARAKVDELYERIDELEAHLEVLNQRGKILDLSKPALHNKTWWESPVDDFTLEDVDRYQAFLKDLQNGSGSYFDALTNETSSVSIPSQGSACYPSLVPSNARNVF